MELPFCIPTKHRLNRDSIIPVLLSPRYCNDNKERKIDFNVLLKDRLLPDLITLLRDGIFVDAETLDLIDNNDENHFNSPATNIPVRLIAMCCDNLAAHEMIGFPLGFTFESFRCRWCYGDGEKCNQQVSETSFFGEKLLQDVQNDQESAIINYCPPTSCENGYHAQFTTITKSISIKRIMTGTCPHLFNVKGFAFAELELYQIFRYLLTVNDIMHDLDEGVVPDVIIILLEIIRNRVKSHPSNADKEAGSKRRKNSSRLYIDDEGKGNFDNQLRQLVSQMKTSHGGVTLERTAGRYEIRGTAAQKLEFFYRFEHLLRMLSVHCTDVVLEIYCLAK